MIQSPDHNVSCPWLVWPRNLVSWPSAQQERLWFWLHRNSRLVMHLRSHLERSRQGFSFFQGLHDKNTHGRVFWWDLSRHLHLTSSPSALHWTWEYLFLAGVKTHKRTFCLFAYQLHFVCLSISLRYTACSSWWLQPAEVFAKVCDAMHPLVQYSALSWAARSVQKQEGRFPLLWGVLPGLR